jgi:Cu(I)/Ag(I) efflux system membrane fusion protein/cobalt-zinc-cadmium efflux system membrane fusion protein
MTSRSKTIALALAAFVLGAALPAAVIWNPARWAWADRIVGRAPLYSGHAGAAAEKKQLWTCGMHPQVIQDKPGNCPICGMRLIPIKDSSASASAGTPEEAISQDRAAGASAERKIRYWRDPMDANYVSDKPGKSPMGMDLIPVYEDEQTLETGVRVDPSFLQNFAVRTEVVERGSIPIEIRTVGVLSHNPDGLYSVNTKFAGWIEKSYFNNVGQHVQRGDLLLEIYSPDLVTTQQEYLAAIQYLEKLSEAKAYPDAVERARSLLESARERLRYWDVTDEQIQELEETRKPRRTVKIYSPATGILAEKISESLEGMRIEPGMTIYHLADHSVLWVEVEVYEHQIRYLREGMVVRVEVEAFPGRVWRGRIVRFSPTVDPQTRTLRAFVEVDNKDQKLRPEMYANILIQPPAVTGAVKVPEQAVLHSGTRSVVIVQKARGLFEPREVKLGPAGGGFQEVRDGLRAGETIVASSQFLIDSESNLKAAIQQLLGAGPRTNGESEPVEAPMMQQPQ